ncbi:outer membrane protein assembly factor BamB family protein [Crateriforma conspicua]|uniref:PQQ enzyme repeat protein n=1 Tax=Crateriforma conspicua TaxID=2527996 RepID=A0A5C5XZG9_9PLAN|nr:PQQ-binding-like beta-propeller repeat protein [Crateriforma conspicua]TWT67831.1 PQQ enzyme repeat protein [Crateriforma conspicua]
MNDVSNAPRATSDPDATAGRLIVIGLAVLAVTAGLIYWFYTRAHETDFQQSLIHSLIAGGIGGLAGLVMIQIGLRRRGYRPVLPAALGVGLLLAIACLRFEGFSGEMVPTFAWRWSGTGRIQPMQSDPKGTSAVDASIQPTAEDEAIDSLPDYLTARFPQFLGPNRNGVLPERQFAIPTSVGEVEQLWKIGVGSGWASFAVADGLAVTLEQRDRNEWVTAYELISGDLIWKVTTDAYHFNALGGEGPRSTPTIVGDKVYTQGASGRVHCIHLRSGDVLWSVDLLEMAGWDQSASESEIEWGRSGSPLIVDNLCVLPYGADESSDDANQRSLIALNADTGDVVWKSGDAQISYASAQLIQFDGDGAPNSRQIVIVNEASITGHAVDDGTVLWSFPWDGDSSGGANCASVIPVGQDRFLIGKGYGGGSALVQMSYTGDAWAADEIWASSRLVKTKFNHAAVDGNIAYGISNGMLECVDLTEPDRRWVQPRRDRCGQGQLLLCQDVLVVQTEPGAISLCEANPREFVELLRLPALESKTWNIPTVAGRYVLVRNDRLAICFRFPELAPESIDDATTDPRDP